MAQQSYALFAVLVALTFAIMSLGACSHEERLGPQAETIPIGATGNPGTEEFHGATIGTDSLRGALPSDN